ncbi:response regulator [Terasakiella sp. A23]|uniref:response regulator n=1 Tax=Terasakiella sp. FCG-A23 TaxID=3080561 RepID=UPI002955613F|nr:response regulator [Terasakiella sp. A23]MDV7338615.1 response regulator [Terasakiella sp. A23]
MGSIDYSLMDALVVDDEKFSLKIVSRIMNQIGFRDVREAKDGGQALSALIEYHEDKAQLVIADFNMPQVTGLQLLKAIRTGTKKVPRDTPLIMLTGNTDKHLVAAAMALDVDAFVAKPVSMKGLQDRINRVLKSARPLKEIEDYQKVDVDIKIAQPADEKKEIEHHGSVLRKDGGGGKEVLLTRVRVGATLARPVRLSDGKIVLNSGVKVTERLVDKLKDLNGLGEKIETLWVE